MFASTSRGGNARQLEVQDHSKNLKLPFRLSFYERPPLDDVTIEEFETFAIDRLRVLAEIEACLVRNRTFEEMKVVLAPRIKTYLPLSSNTAKNIDVDAERRKDLIGHYVLRLAFCRSEELRAKFIKAEAMLFKLRWEEEDKPDQQRFISTLHLDYANVSAEEKAQFSEALRVASRLSVPDFSQENFFKVPWTRVPELVNSRRVFLAAGQAYVPLKEQFTLVLAEFQNRLSKALEITARALPRLDEDDRLVPVLEHLSMGFLAGVTSQYTSKPEEAGEQITAEMVEDLARRHFPACMRNLHDTLRAKKHLKHWGRLQYNLFLKGIGMPIEEALIFWRKSFSSMTDDKFNKDHKYNIRHGYGLEGKRMNYPPKNCQRIIMNDQPGPQDSHGCPFRHFNESALSSLLLSTYRVSNPQETKEILDAAKNGHYHVACTRLFEVSHKDQGVKKGDGVGQGESVTHPNLYYERSVALSKPKTEEMQVDS